ncbi:MAG: PASTA domain-containing protein, partial [Erysipelotrichales bacterium]
MSDFLNNFDENNYQGETIVDNNGNNTPINNHQENNQNNNLEKEKKSFLDIIKKYKYYILGTILVIIAILIYFVMSFIKVPDFRNEQLSNAKEWANKNEVNLKVNEEYSLKQDANIIIKQDKEIGDKIRKNDTLVLSVSKGADPEERIVVPNLEDMEIGAIEEWIADNKLDNVVLDGAYSKSVREGKVISLKYDGDLASANNYKRKDQLTIKISKGRLTSSTKIVVPDFTNGDKYAARDWAIDHGVTLSYSYQRHETQPKNKVIRQSVKKGSKITNSKTINLTISMGNGSVVKNFKSMSYEAAKGVSNANVKMVYSTKKDYGKFIAQSYPAGTRLYGNKKVIVSYSAGRPYVGN